MHDEVTGDVVASTLELRHTVDAAKALLERGRAITPRGGTPARRGGAPAPHPVSDSTESRTMSPAKDIAPMHIAPSTRRRVADGTGGGSAMSPPLSTDGSKRAMLLERNAALEEANRLRRALDAVGDIEQTMHDTVQQAVLKEKQRYRDEVAVLRRESERATSKLKADNDKLTRDLAVKDDRIQSLTMQLASVKSGDAAAAKMDKLHDEISFLTSELVARDTLVDEKSALVTRLQENVDHLERNNTTVTQQLLETQGIVEALQRQERRSNDEWSQRQDAHLATIASLKSDLERAEVEELTLRRTMEQVQVASSTAIQSLTSTVELHCATIAELEASLAAADTAKLCLMDTHQGHLRGTQKTAVSALHANMLARCGHHMLRQWQWWAERRRTHRAERQADGVLERTRLEADGVMQRLHLERSCWLSLVEDVVATRRTLLAGLRRFEQMHGRLEGELHRTESKATMQRDDLKKSMDTVQRELQRAQTELADVHRHNDALREKLQAAELLAQRTALEHAAQIKTEAAGVALLTTRMRDAEANNNQRMHDYEDAIQRERDALERERTMVNNTKNLLSERDAENTELKVQAARLQQDIAHAQSSLEQVRLSSERQSVDWAARSQEWKAEKEGLLESLQQQRDAGRDALAHHVARDAEERVLREKVADADKQRKQALQDLDAYKLEVHHLKRQLQSTQQSLNQQLDTMATLRSSSASNRQSPAVRSIAMAAVPRSPAPLAERAPLVCDPASTPPIPEGQDPHAIESACGPTPGAGDDQTAQDQPISVPPPSEHRDDPEVQHMTAQLKPPPAVVDAAATHLAVPLASAGEEDDSDLSEVAVLRASVASLTEQLRFAETECEWWKAQAARTQVDAKQLDADAAVVAALQDQIATLTTHVQQLQGTNQGLLAEHQRLIDVCNDQQVACGEMRIKMEAAEDMANTLSRELDQTTLLKAELHQRRSLEQQVLAMSTDNIRLEARVRELQQHLDEQRHQVGVLQEALGDAATKEEAPPQTESDAYVELMAERDNLVRCNNMLQEELSDIRALSGEMKSAYDALSSPQPHTPQRHTPPPPPPCARCSELEAELQDAVKHVKILQETAPPSSNNVSDSEGERLRRRRLEVALDVAEVESMQAHSAMKRMEGSKELMEARLRELATEMGTLRHAVTNEERKCERAEEAFASLLHRLCRVLRIPAPQRASSPSPDDQSTSSSSVDACVKAILMAIDALQATVTAATDANLQLQQQQFFASAAAEAYDAMPLVAASKHSGPRVMQAAEVEELLQRLVDTHRREVRKLSLTNTHLMKLLKQCATPPPSIEATSEGARTRRSQRAVTLQAVQCMAANNATRRAAQVWLRWRLLREGRRRERIVVSAQTTVSRLQEQQLKLKDIASAAMRRVKELESSV